MREKELLDIAVLNHIFLSEDCFASDEGLL